MTMASAWPEEETFICSVCLETLKDPATLPCGHTYCLACIEGHWDHVDAKGQYSCPQCRQIFSPRPSLARSTVLVEAMEKLRTRSIKETPHMSMSSAPPSIPIYIEVLPEMVGPQRQGSVYPQLPTVAPRPCPQHHQPLYLYCRDDKECVCDVCCEHGHKGHQVLKPEEERRERQKELANMQADLRGRIEDIEKELREMPQTSQQYKASIDGLQRESVELFSELIKSVELMGSQVGELISVHKAALSTRVEGNVQSLEQEVAQLRWKNEEMNRLAGMEDHICFLKNFLTLEPMDKTGVRSVPGLGQEEVVTGIRSAMTELRDSLQDLCKSSLAKIFRAVNNGSMAPESNDIAVAGSEGSVVVQTTAQEKQPSDRPNAVYEMTVNPPPLPPPRPQASFTPPTAPQFQGNEASCITPSRPSQKRHESHNTTIGQMNYEPKSREEMLKFRFEPTFDPNTVFRHLLLSDGGHKATLKAENLNPADHPERFMFWRQVLCREPLAGSPYYWEVEWTGQKVTIGVAYKEIERKGSDDQSRLGHNAQSWGLYWSGTGFSFWHMNKETQLGSTKARRVGVYLDQHAGILAFYRITNNQAQLIHRYQTQFTGPLLLGFRFGSMMGATVSICQLD